jgi:two-component system sensor kinase FixL
MDWATVIFSATAGMCLSMAAVHLVVRLRAREFPVNLPFSLWAIVVASEAILELAMMHAQTPDQYFELWWWVSIPYSLGAFAYFWFVIRYLGAFRRWLLWTICVVPALNLAVSLLFHRPPEFSAITALQSVQFLGEQVAAPVAVPGPLIWANRINVILILVFIVDAALIAWRKGQRRRPIILGLAFLSNSVGAIVLSTLFQGAERSSPIFISLPALLAILVVGFDLGGDLVRAQKSLRELADSRERLSLATTAADLGVWEWDMSRDEIWATQNIRSRLDFGEDDHPSLERFLQSVHPEDREETRKHIHQALEGGEWETVYRSTNTKGEYRWIASRGKVQRRADGKPWLVRGVSLDITEREKALQALRESEQRFRATFEQAAVGIAHVAPDGTVLRINKKFCDMLHYSEAELLARTFQDITHPDDLDLDLQEMDRLLRGEIETYSMEKRYLHKDGNVVFGSLTVASVRNASGQLEWFVSVVDDITAAKAAELEAQSLRRDLAHLSRVSTVGELTGSLAHELNQPLAAILSAAQAGLRFMSAERSDPAEIRDILQNIVQDIKRAAAVVSGLRSMLRRQPSQRERIDLADAVQEILKMLHTEFLTNHVTVSARCQPDCHVLADKTQIQQVVLNLVMNSIEAMRSSEVDRRHIELSATREATDSVKVTVSDTGPGIPPEDNTKLFDSFWTTKSQGMGIGLTICRSILESHGGRIWLDHSQPGETAFCFSLPLSPEP